MSSTPLTLSQATTSSTPAWNGINYGVMADGWTGTANNSQASEASFKVKCAWGDASNLIDYFLGANNWSSTSGFVTTYIVGMQHPVFRGLFCDQAKIVPYTGVSPAVHQFDFAELQLHFKGLPFDPSSPATIREDEVIPCGKPWPFPPTFFPKSPGQTTASIDKPGYMVYIPEYKIRSTLLGVATVPLSAIGACTAHVSSSNLNFNYGGTVYTIPGSYILYNGASSRRTVLSNGVQRYDVTHEFLVSPIHNKYIDATKAGTGSDALSCFTVAGDGFVNYTPVSFAGLGV